MSEKVGLEMREALILLIGPIIRLRIYVSRFRGASFLRVFTVMRRLPVVRRCSILQKDALFLAGSLET